MISWAVIGCGAVLSVLLAAGLTAIPKPRQASVIVTAAVAPDSAHWPGTRSCTPRTERTSSPTRHW
jgi:hypothetical protein